MKLFNITVGKFDAISAKGIELSMLYLLEKAFEGQDIRLFKAGKAINYISTLYRKGYLDDNGITEAGRELYSSLIIQDSEVKLKRMESKNEEWKKFLSSYPPNNTFTWRGKTFDGDRGIRKNSKDGESLFTKILNDKEYNCDDLCKAVMAEAISKMEQSYKSGENKMRYFINTESWLRQKQYENWVDEGRSLTDTQLEQYQAAYKRGKKAVSKTTYGGFDI